ncbi:MAG TPA: hypothetical protein VHM72_10780 [Solirubrobacteraceae bacterium]|jgi:hypothetical protein|nr:hypothetical protein [Solirubrobacteraceae bacterium]
MVVVVGFGLGVALGLLGSPWSWAAAVSLLAGATAGAVVRGVRELRDTRSQIARLAASFEETQQRAFREHEATSAGLAGEVRRLQDRLRAAERVAGESWVRLQRYDLLQRPGGFEIELFCDGCNAWRPSGVISTWEHFTSDEPFVSADGRFILSCGHEVTADTYKARPGAKVAPSVRRPLPAAEAEPLNRSRVSAVR